MVPGGSGLTGSGLGSGTSSLGTSFLAGEVAGGPSGRRVERGIGRVEAEQRERQEARAHHQRDARELDQAAAQEGGQPGGQQRRGRGGGRTAGHGTLLKRPPANRCQREITKPSLARHGYECKKAVLSIVLRGICWAETLTKPSILRRFGYRIIRQIGNRSDDASPRQSYWDKRRAADRSASPCRIKNGLVGLRMALSD